MGVGRGSAGSAPGSPAVPGTLLAPAVPAERRAEGKAPSGSKRAQAAGMTPRGCPPGRSGGGAGPSGQGGYLLRGSGTAAWGRRPWRDPGLCPRDTGDQSSSPAAAADTRLEPAGGCGRPRCSRTRRRLSLRSGIVPDGVPAPCRRSISRRFPFAGLARNRAEWDSPGLDLSRPR